MRIMQDSMAHPRMESAVDLASWKHVAALASAILLAALFIFSGGWKVTDPFAASALLAQMKAPGGMPSTILLGALEVFGGVLLLIPKFRRWGALLIGAMTVFFIAYATYHYSALVGKECSCFPWLKRTIGPGFFIGDTLMVVGAVLAYLWSKPSAGLRQAAMIAAVVAVFSGASYGVAYSQNTGKAAPESILVDGQATPLAFGKVFLYFYDPECAHCDEAAKRMSKWNWKDTKVIGIPTRVPHFGADFMKSTQLNAVNSSDVDLLKKIFPFGDPPFGVSLENGRQKTAHPIFDKSEPESKLRELGFIQ